MSLVFRITLFENVFAGSFQNLLFCLCFIFGKTGSFLTFRDSEILDVGGG